MNSELACRPEPPAHANMVNATEYADIFPPAPRPCIMPSEQLAEMKKGCEPNCFSTLGYNVAYCYSAPGVMKWPMKQAMNRFQGVTGSF